MKTLLIFVIIVAAAYYGWKYMDRKVDVQKATETQAREMDAEVQKAVSRVNPSVAPAGQTVAPSAPASSATQRTAESIRQIGSGNVDSEYGDRKQ